MKLTEFIADKKYINSNPEKIKADKFPHDALNLYTYYDKAKCLHLLIQTDLRYLESRKGLKVENKELEIIDHGKHHFLDFYCKSPDFINNFLRIAEDILEDFESRNNLEKSIKLTINKWFFFFEKEKAIELQEQEIIGLIGELFFIKEYLISNTDVSIIENWKGPEKYPNDFSLTNYDIEVKTSTKELGHIHTINGQSQITVIDDPLYIYSINFKRSASESAITIKKLIDNISDYISPNKYVLNTFYEKLELLSINPYYTDMYDYIKVELNNIITVKINSENLHEFLIYNSNDRISNIKYDFDFNGLDDLTNEIM